MKNKLFLTLAVLLIFTGCDTETETGVENVSVDGTWVADGGFMLELKAKFIFHNPTFEFYSTDLTSNSQNIDKGTYSISGNTVTLTSDDKSVNGTGAVYGNTLTIAGYVTPPPPKDLTLSSCWRNAAGGTGKTRRQIAS
jgi:hypothetical protein